MTDRRCRAISASAQEHVRAEIFASARHLKTSSKGADMKKLVLAIVAVTALALASAGIVVSLSPTTPAKADCGNAGC